MLTGIVDRNGWLMLPFTYISFLQPFTVVELFFIGFTELVLMVSQNCSDRC
uniref:Uncharacterized protein n=1 Tax=Arundo donax TaxID=35708 RepID=A0A0A9BZY4_ARUDO